MVPSIDASQLDARTLDSFTCFPRLPLELRRNIWMWACFHTRDVHLGTIPRTPRGRSAFEVDRYLKYVSRTPYPSILHTNQESRAEGRLWYDVDCEVKFKISFSIFARIPINWAADRICVDDDWALDGILELEKVFVQKRVRRLVLNEYDQKTPNLLWLLNTEYLQELTIVSDARPFKPDGNYLMVATRAYYLPAHVGIWTEIRKKLILRWPGMELPTHLRWFYGGKAVPCRHGDDRLVLTLSHLWHNDCDTSREVPEQPWKNGGV